MVRRTWFAVFALAGCDWVFLAERPAAPPDARPDAAPPPIEAFGVPTKLAPFDGPTEDDDPSMTADGLELYLLRSADIWRSVRATDTDPWPAPVQVAELNTIGVELRPAVSADGRTIYFARGPAGDRDIYAATRATRTAAWSTPLQVALDRSQSGTEELPGWSSDDGLQLMFDSNADGKRKLYLATRPDVNAPFTSVPLDGVNRAGFDDDAPWATPDGTRIMFQSNRSGTAAFWEAVAHEGNWYVHYHDNLDTADPEGTPWMSPDGSTLVFSRTTNGSDDLWIATRAPIARR